MCNQFSPGLPNQVESVRVNIDMPVVRTNGRSGGRTFTWLPNVLGWVDYHVFFGMGLRPRLTLAVEFRYIKRCLSCVYSNSDNVDTSQNSQL